MKENNKFLADFLELETTEHNRTLFLTQDHQLDLQYDEIWNPLLDWNQLMQVVHKCLQICNENMLNEWEVSFSDKFFSCNIGNMYDETLKFIKWYKNV